MSLPELIVEAAPEEYGREADGEYEGDRRVCTLLFLSEKEEEYK